MSNNKTIIEIDENEMKYIHNRKIKPNNYIWYVKFLIIIFIFILSIIFSLLTYFEWDKLTTLKKYKRIRRSMNSWEKISNNKTSIESNKGKLVYLSKPNTTDFKCIDYGNYFVVGRINNDSYLPQFVRRGNSGVWIISKSDVLDESAKQFCDYLLYENVISTLNQNYITCGNDMFDKLGYSGYFINNSVCELFLSKII